jgi:cytoskeleton protein RodZ
VNANDAPEAPPADAAPVATAGMILAHTREALGLSIDDVALQLKLAPRQVVAIERDDFASLPGRTFIRGFVRNYARLLKLDVDAVLEALPGEHGAPPDRPPLAATARAIGEMPRDRAARPNVARWAIPVVLVAIVAVAAFYEFARPPVARSPSTSAPPPPAVPPTSAVPLANPVRSESVPATAPAESATAAESAQAAMSSPTPAPSGAAPANAAAEPATAPAGTPLVNPLGASGVPSTGATAQSSVPPATTPERNVLAVRFRGTSWIEVRDRTGNVILSMTGSDGATREMAVSPPGEIIVGNVPAVEASWRGRALDLAGQSKQNVARIKLD